MQTSEKCFGPPGVTAVGMHGRGTRSRHSACAAARQSEIITKNQLGSMGIGLAVVAKKVASNSSRPDSSTGSTTLPAQLSLALLSTYLLCE